ncbi:MAG: methionyl-tRNA formyltransferase [Acidimicrobiia bacterium]|nr:methionyl-tRNA formyltransferase [Acidimicrobiia bacterium]MBT8194421.1 methionyl-tRNA formyltransferase [Acidimicrobiia bacterium]NNL14513.1 methionyl-tRNA formyltransferase [Acidimicrobiia bacterium]NNL97948.1 methionyl-tRNA formyltransferase [Acidimicrobiia bacterium]
MAAPARTAFFGTPPAAVPALAALAASTDVELVVTRPDKPRGRSGKPQPSAVKEAAEAWGLPVAQPNRAREVVELLQGLDLAVVVAYGQILPADVLAAPAHGFVNVHFSRLPRWRGAAPVARAILAGDEATGVDIIQLDEGMDTGPLIARREASIDPNDTTGTLTARLAGLGAELLVETLPAIIDDTAVRTPQAESGVTIAAKLTSEEARIDPHSMTAADIDRVVRAFNPNPGAWGSVDGARLKVWETRVRADLTVPPGQSELIDRLPVVGTSDGAVELVEIQAAGKSRLPAEVWARGYRGALLWD